MTELQRPRRVLVTGAAGRVAQLAIPALAERYDLTLTDLRPAPRLAPAPFACANIANASEIGRLCLGVDTILHLAAADMHAPWEALLSSNIVGTYNLLGAARDSGCSRVIFASSIQAVDGYPPEVVVRPTMPPRPSTLYGATKVWGEAVGSYFSHHYNLSVICLRLGKVLPNGQYDVAPWLNRVLTSGDLVQLFIVAIEAPPDLRFALLHGLSNNRHQRLDIDETRRALGYAPRDDAYELARTSRLARARCWLSRAGPAVRSRLRRWRRSVNPG